MSQSAADRLYKLLPSVYRLRDFDQGEPLRALLSLIEREYAVLEKNIGDLYDDWFIETCHEWVVPYIGDLFGVRSLYPASSATFSARAYVAHALDYRSRKGTAAMLAQLAHDVTGWPARVVEFFELLATTQRLNHLRPANIVTPDLRDSSLLELLGGPFERFAHTADVRHISRGRGRYNIPSLGIFLWRIQDYFVGPIPKTAQEVQRQGDARAAASPPDGRFTFDPLGANVPLFNHPQTTTGETLLVDERNVAGPLRRRPLSDELEALRQTGIGVTSPVYFGDNPVFQIMVDGKLVPFDQIMICDTSDISSTDWRRPPAKKSYPDGDKPIALSVDPMRGRVAFPIGAKPSSVQVAYSYGFSGDLGAGPYDRTAWLSDDSSGPGLFKNLKRWQAAVSQQLSSVPDQVFSTLADALKAWKDQTVSPDGVIAVLDSRTYAADLTVEIPEGRRLLIVAADWPALRQPGPVKNLGLDPNRLRPHIRGKIDVKGTATAASQNPGSLFIDGLLVEGPITVVAGNLGLFTLSHTTITPGSGLKVEASGASDNSRLTLNLYRGICGPVSLAPSISALKATDSIISSGKTHSEKDAAITAVGSTISIQTSTVFGTTKASIVEAGNSIFTGTVNAQRRQAGCVRFCYLPAGSRTARPYHCQPELALTGIFLAAAQKAVHDRLTPQFASTDFGQPSYAQLSSRCAEEITTGAEDGAEMGAFSFLRQPQRKANLLTVLDEYLRFGLETGIIEET